MGRRIGNAAWRGQGHGTAQLSTALLEPDILLAFGT